MSALATNPDILPFARPALDAASQDGPASPERDPVYQLANNENPLGPSPKVIEALRSAAPTLGMYPRFTDIALRRAIVAALGRDLGVDQIFTGCSGFETLELIARAFISPGDEVILSTPTFRGAYAKVTLPLGARIVDVPRAPGSFALRVEAVLEAITARTRLIMLCNPNNPTGTITSAGQLERLMRGLPERALLVADEVYHHFVDDPDYPDSLGYVHEGANIVIVHSFSKAYGMAGLRLGYGIARPEIANYIAGLHRGFHQNSLAMAAGIAACADQEHVQRSIDFVRGELHWLGGQFDRLDIKYWKPAGNFILFETPMLADGLRESLLDRGIALRAQTGNQLPYALRVSVGTRAANRAFIATLESILAEAAP